MVEKLIIIFKFVEPVFWLAQAWIIINLFDAKGAFISNLKVINWLIRKQGFESQLAFTEKAFKTWHRDLWILFFMNPVIIVLIHLI